MNVKNFTAIMEKMIRDSMPYGYDNTENLLIGINVDGVVCDIENIRFVRGGFVIDPAINKKVEQKPKLLQPQKTKKEQTENESK